VGGGAKGNVPAGSIAKVVSAVNQLKLVTNVKGATGGADAEATAAAVQRGPHLFRAMGRAVTASDYEALARTFGAGKAKAQATAWNNVRLIVAPAGGGVVSKTFRSDLITFLDDKRMMTVQVEIGDPAYINVLIDATVNVLPQFSQRLVQQQVSDAVGQLFAFDNVDFGQRIFISKVYEVIQEVDGVQGVVISTFARQDPDNPDAPIASAIPTTGQLTFDAAKGEIPTWNGFTLGFSPPGTPSGSRLSRLVMQGGASNG